jgi:hypothetical protein
MAPGKLGYMLSVAIPVTVMGVLAQQLYEISRGRDPKPMDPTTPEGRNLWGQGFLKGGALSIVGDLIGMSAQGRYMSAAEYAAGPLAGDVDRAISAGHGIATGQKGAAEKAFQLGKEQVPGGNVWYLRLAIDRMLADQIQRQIDPEYDDSWRAMQKRAATQGQEFYWQPGELAPRRAPDLSKAFEGGNRQ